MAKVEETIDEGEVVEMKTTKPEMKLTVMRDDLLAELKIAVTAVERKTTIPILSNVRLEAVGAVLQIQATDLSQSIQTSCAAQVKTEGSCTVPAHKLLSYLKLLPAGEVSLSYEDGRLKVKCGRSNTKIVSMASATFPGLPSMPEDRISIPAKLFRSMMDRVAFAVSTAESRYTLNGALFEVAKDSILLVATDGHRMAHVKSGGSFGEKYRTLVPAGALEVLSGLLAGEGDEALEVGADESTLFFRLGARTLSSRRMSGQFPNYDGVMPKEAQSHVVVLARDLDEALKRAAQFSDEHSGRVSFAVDGGTIKVSSSSVEAGSFEETIPVDESSNPPFEIAFRGKYLSDFLRVNDSEKISLRFTTAGGAGELNPESGDLSYRYIVMPMR